MKRQNNKKTRWVEQFNFDKTPRNSYTLFDITDKYRHPAIGHLKRIKGGWLLWSTATKRDKPQIIIGQNDKPDFKFARRIIMLTSAENDKFQAKPEK